MLNNTKEKINGAEFLNYDCIINKIKITHCLAFFKYFCGYEKTPYFYIIISDNNDIWSIKNYGLRRW